MLKGRYYHGGHFLTSTRKRHASLTEHPILAGHDVPSKGLIRRIGNGNSTNIWTERWLPEHFGGRPLTPADGQLVTRVSELLSENGHWNEELIRHTFIPVDAAAILCTPARAQLDVWAWEPKKHGVYLVRWSAYRLLDTACIRNIATHDTGGLGDTCCKNYGS